MTTAYTRTAVVQPEFLGGLNFVSMVGTGCQFDTTVRRLGAGSTETPRASLPSALIALAPMSTAASESAPQRIATIREQLKLLGDYL
jgi:hypothetical protein